MRVITGKARGRRLETLEGMDVRPTTDMVKEAIFSAIQFDIEGAFVLDLFSGSGQLGIEALSRGAEKAVFVDKSKSSIGVTIKNVETTGFSESAKIVNMDSLDYLKRTDEKFDIALLDPPYRKGFILPALELLNDKMNDGGKIICEHEPEFDAPEAIGELLLKKQYSYGKIKVSLYIKGEN